MLTIGYKAAFLRQLKKLPASLQEEANECISLFRQDPKHSSLRVHKLKGPLKGRWSFSVNYEYRIVFVYQQKNTAILLAVGDHDVYQ